MHNIPKILHLFWGRVNPLSKLQIYTVLSFRKFNPDYKIKIWVNSIPCEKWDMGDIKLPEYTGKDYFNCLYDIENVEIIDLDFQKVYRIPNLYNDVWRSDLFRYVILYEEGGFWSDFDVIWLNSIDKIEENM